MNRALVLAGCIVTAAIAARSSLQGQPGGAAAALPTNATVGIHKIKHIVIIIQENRAFDHDFGTFPGADGIPMRHGVPTVCVPNPKVHRRCQQPYHDTHDQNTGGPHRAASAVADIDDDKMDGFLGQYGLRKALCKDPTNPACGGGHDVVGYHDDHESPNYWAYARNFVLQDRELPVECIDRLVVTASQRP